MYQNSSEIKIFHMLCCAQSSGHLWCPYYPCHDLNQKTFCQKTSFIQIQHDYLYIKAAQRVFLYKLQLVAHLASLFTDPQNTRFLQTLKSAAYYPETRLSSNRTSS